MFQIQKWRPYYHPLTSLSSRGQWQYYGGQRQPAAPVSAPNATPVSGCGKTAPLLHHSRRGVCCVAAGRVVIEGHWLARQKILGQWGFVPIKFSADVLALIMVADYAHRIDCPHLIWQWSVGPVTGIAAAYLARKLRLVLWILFRKCQPTCIFFQEFFINKFFLE